MLSRSSIYSSLNRCVSSSNLCNVNALNKRFIFGWFGKKNSSEGGEMTLEQSMKSGKLKLVDKSMKWSPKVKDSDKNYPETVAYSIGQNAQGQLGLNDQSSETKYIFNEFLQPYSIKSIKSSLLHTAAETYDNDLITFGCNIYFQIGHRRTSHNTFLPHFIESLPYSVKTGTSLGKVKILDYSLGGWASYVIGKPQDTTTTTPTTGIIKNNVIENVNEIYVWGNSYFGQLGLGDKLNYQPPTRISRMNFKPLIPPDDQIVKVTAGLFHSLFLSEKGRVYSSGLVLNQTFTGPNQVQGLPNDIQMISSGCFHSVAWSPTTPMDIYVWGKGKLDHDTKSMLMIGPYFSSSQLPEKLSNDELSPIKISIAGLEVDDKIIQIESGDGISLILTEKGRLFMIDVGTGVNGKYSEITSSIPLVVDQEKKIKKVVLSTTHAGVIYDQSNEFYVWSLYDSFDSKSKFKNHFTTLLENENGELVNSKLFKFPQDHIIKDLSLGHHFSILIAEKKVK